MARLGIAAARYLLKHDIEDPEDSVAELTAPR